MILMCTKLLVCETSVIRNLVVCALSDAVWFASEGKPINFITVEYQLITSILLTVCIVQSFQSSSRWKNKPNWHYLTSPVLSIYCSLMLHNPEKYITFPLQLAARSTKMVKDIQKKKLSGASGMFHTHQSGPCIRIGRHFDNSVSIAIWCVFTLKIIERAKTQINK